MVREMAPDLEIRLRLQDLCAEYAACIDDDRLESWPSHFTADGRYIIITNENYQLGHMLGIVYCNGRGMMTDRITAMREANIFEPHRYRHMVGPPRIFDGENSEIRAETNFTVHRIMHSGETMLFASGKYVDRIVENDGELKFKERLAILDSRQIDTLLVIPI